MANYTAPRTWVPGETATDVMLNAQIRDNELELMKSIGLFGHNYGGAAVVAGGIVPFRLQIGTNANTSDVAGLTTILFPVAFPNALLVVLTTNADYSSNGDVYFSTALYSPTQFTYGTFRSGAVVAGIQHRINWIAIGW